MGVFAALLELQAIDTAVDQLRHRLAHLPETAGVEEVLGRQRALDSERRAVQGEADRLTNEISAGESRTEEIRHHLERLNRQMKTIIAPREAEALQHEIDTLKSETSDIDDRCLAAMDDLGAAESRVAELARALESAAGEVDAARAAEAAAAAEVRASIEEQQRLRESSAAGVPAAMLESYDTKRSQLAGIAVARLTGLSCGGCHLDISRSEADQLGKTAEDERECPNCSRWLVL